MPDRVRGRATTPLSPPQQGGEPEKESPPGSGGGGGWSSGSGRGGGGLLVQEGLGGWSPRSGGVGGGQRWAIRQLTDRPRGGFRLLGISNRAQRSPRDARTILWSCFGTPQLLGPKAKKPAARRGRVRYLLLQTRPELEYSLTVRLFAVIGHRHENDPLLFINLVKQPPIAYAVAPRGWIPAFQTLDVGTEVRVFAKYGIDMLAQLGCQPPCGHGSKSREITQALPGLEDSIGW